MKISLIRKERGRVYKSADIVRALFGFELDHDGERAPHLKGPECEGLFISISDTVNYWACCIEPHPVGLDMEVDDANLEALLTGTFITGEDMGTYLIWLTSEDLNMPDAWETLFEAQ